MFDNVSIEDFSKRGEVIYNGTTKEYADCNALRRLLQDINPKFDIEFNYETKKYTIYHNGAFFMNVDYGAFTRETFTDIRKVVYQNENGTVFEEMDKHNEKIEASIEKDRENFAESLAKDIRKSVVKAIDHGELGWYKCHNGH